jgi:hypothetical protein
LALEGSLAAIRANFAVNLAHGEFILALLAGCGPDSGDDMLFRGDGLEKVLDTHNYDLRLSAAIYDEPGLIEAGSPHDLSELGPGR